MAYNYPTAEGIKSAMKEGWSKEQAKRGFEIFDFDGLGILEIEAIGDCFPDQTYEDEEAAREAERTGYCKIIPVNELPAPFIIDGIDRRYFGWVDTPENRKRIEEFVNEKTLTKDIMAMFPDWHNMKPGDWSEYGKTIKYAGGHAIEIGLYREPMENEEYAGTYTFQIFDGDDVIFCSKVEEDW